MFGDVFILIFLTAISEYDQVIDEDKTTNRIEESLKLFNTILNYPVFMDKDVIVFLNKNDLLEQKIQERRSLLSDHFPEFTGDNHNVNEVRKFFQVMHFNHYPYFQKLTYRFPVTRFWITFASIGTHWMK